MKICAVHKCGNDSSKRPDLTYFSLPKHASIREEWLEILGVKSSHNQHVFVCELHFRAKDIREGKKELKTHSVPVLRLGTGQVDPIDSEDEFMTYDLNSESEIELQESLPITPKNVKAEQELIENQKIKQEPNPNTFTKRKPPKKKKGYQRMLKENRERTRIKRGWSTLEREPRLQEVRTKMPVSCQVNLAASLCEANVEDEESITTSEQNLLDTHKSMQECETGRRPSRRAAIVAAKKISNTVRSYSLGEDAEFTTNASITPKPSIKTERVQKRKRSPTPPPQPPLPPEPPIEISLDMECDEEILSETQAETLSKAQSHYNLVMKGLRELVQCNVKVIQTDPYGTVIVNPPPIPFQTIPVKNAVISTSKPRTSTLVFRTEAPRIVPVALSVAKSQPSIIII